MDEITKEKISALVDGEISQQDIHELLNELRTNPTYLDCWQHYHLISDALSNNLSNPVNSKLARRVSLALESEPTLLSPSTPRRSSNKIIFTKPLAGFALAASVAAIAFLGVGRHSGTNGPTLAVQQEAAVTVAMTPAALAEKSTDTATYNVVKGTRWDVNHPAMESRLNNYLLNHDEFTAYAGAQSGILPHVRIVGYEAVEAVR